MRFAAVVLLLGGVAYGVWSFDRTLMLSRRRVVAVVCVPAAEARL